MARFGRQVMITHAVVIEWPFSRAGLAGVGAASAGLRYDLSARARTVELHIRSVCATFNRRPGNNRRHVNITGMQKEVDTMHAMRNRFC
jgi:hypothetical protein